jgi:hypothetical protein
MMNPNELEWEWLDGDETTDNQETSTDIPNDLAQQILALLGIPNVISLELHKYATGDDWELILTREVAHDAQYRDYDG